MYMHINKFIAYYMKTLYEACYLTCYSHHISHIIKCIKLQFYICSSRVSYKNLTYFMCDLSLQVLLVY